MPIIWILGVVSCTRSSGTSGESAETVSSERESRSENEARTSTDAAAGEQTPKVDSGGTSSGVTETPLPPGLTVLYRRPTALLRRGLMSDETDLFWGEYSDENGLLMHAASKSGGGEVRTLGKWYDYPSAQTLTLDAEYVYWMRDEADGQVVVRVSKQGGDERVYPLPVPEEGGLSLGYIAFVDDELWLITRGCNYVVRMSPDGGQASLLKMSPYKNVGSSTGFVVREGKVYCGNGPL